MFSMFAIYLLPNTTDYYDYYYDYYYYYKCLLSV